METLEEQLAQLKLLNSRPLSPRIQMTPTGNGSPKKVGPAVPPKPMKKNFPQVPQSIVVQKACEPLYSKRLQMDSSNNQNLGSSNLVNNSTNPKKLRFGGNSNDSGSSSVVLQSTSENDANKLPILHRKQPAYAQQHHVYSNIKMTLDNPAILDQQLEALEYHKKQLEKKGLMPMAVHKIGGPKLSSASYINSDIAAAAATTKVSPSVSMMAMMLEQQSSPTPPPPVNNLYTNTSQQQPAINYHKSQLSNSSLGSSSNSSTSSSTNRLATANTNRLNDNNCQKQKQPDIVYSNIMHHHHPQHSGNSHDKGRFNVNGRGSAQDLVYNNIEYGSDDLPPPPPIDSVPAPLNLTTATSPCLDYLTQEASTGVSHQNINSEDELPPPPSPVSSSYSELRRATDNFPQMPTYPISGYQTISTANTTAGNGANLSGTVLDHAGNIIMADHNGSRLNCSRQSLNNSQLGSTVDADSMINATGTEGPHQTYMNTLYHNDYSTYTGPSSQSFSQSSSASDYYGYGSISQGSLTYDSIYEPINPRPPSQLSSRSNYSLYTSYVNGPQSTSSGSRTPIMGNNGMSTLLNGNPVGTTSKLPNHKEAEVEALTDLLVHSMGSRNDVDAYGICVKCGERVVGENSGCTAMDQIYHIACFTCNQCQINLQGKPFYALENHPYCEEDYLNTLEKCSVCMKPILERILRATGKPYHPQCFTCVVCDNSLDGIPFTVDATNQNYCIQDFHKKFAPRCCVCRQPIMPEPGQEETVRVVALDRSFHFACYKCEDCGLLLSSEAEGRGCYPLDDHVLCKSCNAKRVQALTNRMTTEL